MVDMYMGKCFAYNPLSCLPLLHRRDIDGLFIIGELQYFNRLSRESMAVKNEVTAAKFKSYKL